MKSGSRLLIVEDDAAIARLLELELSHRGFDVHRVGDGRAAVAAIAEVRPDAVVLDILLPGMDGERVLRQVRRSGNTVPVIMLTARDKTGDKIRALDGGADDYLTKPFQIEELLARLRAVLRRTERDEVLRVGDLEINTAAREVRRGQDRIELTAREYALLEFMARNARRVLPRDLLLERVWEHAEELDPNVLDVYIGYLRRKIERPDRPRLIQTVRGVGFALREE